MTPTLDVPTPFAGLIIAALTIAVSYLALVDWTHPEDPPR